MCEQEVLALYSFFSGGVGFILGAALIAGCK